MATAIATVARARAKTIHNPGTVYPGMLHPGVTAMVAAFALMGVWLAMLSQFVYDPIGFTAPWLAFGKWAMRLPL